MTKEDMVAALNEFYAQKLPALRDAVDERILDLVELQFALFVAMLGFLGGIALWITLRNSL